jgi:hypothetical protein
VKFTFTAHLLVCSEVNPIDQKVLFIVTFIAKNGKCFDRPVQVHSNAAALENLIAFDKNRVKFAALFELECEKQD